MSTSKQYTNDMQDNSLKVPRNKEGINQSHLCNIVCFASYSFHPIIIIFVMLLFVCLFLRICNVKENHGISDATLGMKLGIKDGLELGPKLGSMLGINDAFGLVQHGQ